MINRKFVMSVYIDSDAGDLYGDMDGLNRVFSRSQIWGDITDVAKESHPRVMREVLRGRGFDSFPLIMSTEEDLKVRKTYNGVCAERFSD